MKHGFKSKGRGEICSHLHSTQQWYIKILITNDELRFSTFMCCLLTAFYFDLEIVKMLGIICMALIVVPRVRELSALTSCTYMLTLVFQQNLPHSTTPPSPWYQHTKACVCYFLSNVYFFKTIIKVYIIEKALFFSIFCNFQPPFPHSLDIYIYIIGFTLFKKVVHQIF